MFKRAHFPPKKGPRPRPRGADTHGIAPAAAGTCAQVPSATPAKPHRHLFPSFSAPLRPWISQVSLPGHRGGGTYPGFGPWRRRGSWGAQPRAQRLPHGQAAYAVGAAPAASSSPPPDRMLAGRPRPALRAPGIDPSTPRPLRRRCPSPALACATPSFPPPSCWASRVSLTAQTLLFVPPWPTCLDHSVLLALR